MTRKQSGDAGLEADVVEVLNLRDQRGELALERQRELHVGDAAARRPRIIGEEERRLDLAAMRIGRERSLARYEVDAMLIDALDFRFELLRHVPEVCVEPAVDRVEICVEEEVARLELISFDVLT